MTKIVDFNVQKYQELALKSIEEIHARGKIPIIAGGTNYYIEALLFEQSQKVSNDIISQIHKEGCEHQVIYDDHFKSVKTKIDEKFHEAISDFWKFIPPDDKAAIEDKYAEVS